MRERRRRWITAAIALLLILLLAGLLSDSDSASDSPPPAPGAESGESIGADAGAVAAVPVDPHTGEAAVGGGDDDGDGLAPRGPLAGRRQHRNLRAEGGEARTESASDLGIEWLARHVSPDGGWDADGFSARCIANACGGPGHPDADPAVTALAVMAFLGAGQTPKHGGHRDTVRAAFGYLLRTQGADGAFGPTTPPTRLAAHALATLAVVEAYSLTASGTLKESALRALERLRAEGAHDGGAGDPVASACALHALVVARVCGLVERGTEVRLPALEDARWDDPLRAARVFLRPRFDVHAPEDAAFREDVRILMTKLPSSEGEPDYVTWHYASLALFLHGGSPWKRWNEAQMASLLPRQRLDGDERGSWDPEGPGSEVLGRVGITALNVLTLEVYYRYPRPLRAD